MMTRFFLLATVASLGSLVFAEDTVELTDSSFDGELEEIDTALVMFYAPWCGHCKRLKPEFEKAASVLKANDPPITLAKVDCTEGGQDTCGRFSVSGYPTIKIFRNGELSQDYSGPREAAGIIKYMKAQVGDASKECKTEAELTALLAKPEVVVVNYDKANDAVFQKVANAMRETVAFGHTEGDKGLVLHRPKHLQSKFEASEVKYEGKMDKSAIEKWIKENYHGLVGHRTVDNAREFKEPLVTVYFDVDYVKNIKGTNYWRNRVMKVAQEFPELNFAICNKNDFQHEATEFGLDTNIADKPLVAIKAKAGKFVMKDAFDMPNLKKFLTAFSQNLLEAYLKSEPVPTEQGPVKVAVAKNFDELVVQNTKDVLVEFYAPWCGHCKKLAPVFDELGAKMEGTNVDIVKMDATANDVPAGYDVRGFPTLFWVPSDTKKPIPYNGGRELADFVKFIDENKSKAKTEL
jgi:protein disulfide isomerase family A protein 3